MLLIEHGYLIDPASGTEGRLDVLVEDGRIVKIAPSDEMEVFIQMRTGTHAGKNEAILKRLDAQGCIVAPGLVDVHVHFRDPGFIYKEDITTGAKAAAAGGYTTVVMMANTKPAIDNQETLAEVLEKGRQTGIHVESCACVTVGLAGESLTEMETLKAAGAVGFTDDGIPIMDEALVREAMERTAVLDVPVSFHEEDKTYIKNNGIHAGRAADHYGIGGSPREAEISLVKRDLGLALETGAIINIQHISSKEAVELVRQFRKKSSRIHAEATPHHIALTEEAAIQKGTLAKMNPPLRTEEDRQAIIEGLKDGTIDLIATDHAPHSAEEKAKPITEAPSGIIGLETALALCNMHLVKSGALGMAQVIAKMTCNPARMYHLDAGYLAEDGPADLIVFAPDEEWRVEKFYSKSANSPFIGETLTGRVRATVCGGEVVFSVENKRK